MEGKEKKESAEKRDEIVEEYEDGEEEDEEGEERVQNDFVNLGFAEPPERPEDLSRFFFPSKVGGRPVCFA